MCPSILINRQWCYNCSELHVNHNICITKLWDQALTFFIYTWFSFNTVSIQNNIVFFYNRQFPMFRKHSKMIESSPHSTQSSIVIPNSCSIEYTVFCQILLYIYKLLKYLYNTSCFLYIMSLTFTITNYHFFWKLIHYRILMATVSLLYPILNAFFIAIIYSIKFTVTGFSCIGKFYISFSLVIKCRLTYGYIYSIHILWLCQRVWENWSILCTYLQI